MTTGTHPRGSSWCGEPPCIRRPGLTARTRSDSRSRCSAVQGQESDPPGQPVPSALRRGPQGLRRGWAPDPLQVLRSVGPLQPRNRRQGPSAEGPSGRLGRWLPMGKSPQYCCHVGCILPRVPATSLRQDCEESAQIWSSCGDITIKPGGYGGLGVGGKPTTERGQRLAGL